MRQINPTITRKNARERVCVCEREFTLPNGCRATAYSFILRESRERSDSMNSFTSSCSVSAYFVKICLRTFAYLLTSGDAQRERAREIAKDMSIGVKVRLVTYMSLLGSSAVRD